MKNLLNKVLILTSSTVIPYVASAADIYVDANASLGGNGSESMPYTTLNESLENIVVGEANTIHTTGMFHEYLEVGPTYGGLDEYTRTTIQGWEGHDRPVNDATGTEIPGDIFDLTGAYITLRGFEVIGAKSAANIWSGNGAHHVIVEDCITHGARGNNSKGICFRGSRDAIIRNNIAYDIDEVGIYIPGQGSINAEVYNNISYGNGRYGIKGVDWADNLHIHDNLVYENGHLGDRLDISGISYTSSQPHMARGIKIEHNTILDEAKGIFIGSGYDLLVNGNIIARGTENGIVVADSDSVTLEDNVIGGFTVGVDVHDSYATSIRRNIIQENRRFGIAANFNDNMGIGNNIISDNVIGGVSFTDTPSFAFVHNTLAYNPTAVSYSTTQPLTPKARVFNNVFSHSVTTVFRVNSPDPLNNVQLDYNAYSSNNYYAFIGGKRYSTNGDMCDDLNRDCNSIGVSDPGYINSSEGDYHLRVDSPLIGAGNLSKSLPNDLDRQKRFLDSEVDIGADEFVQP